MPVDQGQNGCSLGQRRASSSKTGRKKGSPVVLGCLSFQLWAFVETGDRIAVVYLPALGERTENSKKGHLEKVFL